MYTVIKVNAKTLNYCTKTVNRDEGDEKMEVDVMLKFGHEDIKRFLEHLIEMTQSQQKPKSTGSSLDEFISELEKKLNEMAGNEEAAKP